MTLAFLIRCLAVAGGVYLLLNLYALLVSDRLLFVPQEPGYTELDHELKIATADGRQITAVYLEHPDADYTILFSHGNAEDLSRVVPFMQQVHDMGYSVLMYDYCGYGTSAGLPSTLRTKHDAEAAYRWLTEEKGIDPKRIIAQGRSLGGAVATWLAGRHEVGGLIVEISFVSAFRVKTHWPLLPWDKFNSLRSIRKVQCPVLVIHGTDDEIIPFWHGRRLYDAAPGPKQHLWIKNGMHRNYVYVAEEEYFKAIGRFREELLQPRETTADPAD